MCESRNANAGPSSRALDPAPCSLPPGSALLTSRLALTRCRDRRVRGVDADAALRATQLRMAVRGDPGAGIRDDRGRGDTGGLLEAQRRQVGRVARRVGEEALFRVDQ